jgi:biotin operon repressor
MEAPPKLSAKIVVLLHEIIIRGAEQIYEIQKNRAPHWNRLYPYHGPIVTFSLKADLLQVKFCNDLDIASSPEGWNTPALHEIESALDDFNRHCRHLGTDPEGGLELIRKYLCPTTLRILRALDESYGFSPGRDPNFVLMAVRTAGLFYEDEETGLGLFGKNVSFVEYYKSLDLLRAGAKDELKGARDLEIKVEEFHLALAGMEREAARKQTVVHNDTPSRAKVKPDGRLAKKGLPKLEEMDISAYLDGAPLTERQKDCALLKWGYRLSDTDIAQRLGISRATVQEHLEAARKKIGYTQENAKRGRGIKSTTRD